MSSVRKHPLLLFLAIVPLVGCRTNPACERQIGLMRAELISLEDKYYALESKYRQAVGHDPLVEPEVCTEYVAPAVTTPRPVEPQPAKQPSDSDIQIQIDPGDSSRYSVPLDRQSTAPPRFEAAQNDASFRPPPRFAQAPNNGTSQDGGHGSPRIHDESVQPVNGLARGDEFSATESSRDDSPAVASDGMSVLQRTGEPPSDLSIREVRTWDSGEGLTIDLQFPAESELAKGELTVSLIDPAEHSERQRIGLWHIAGQELASALEGQNSPAIRSAAIDLPWNLNAPQHTELLLFARWKEPEKDSLEVSLPVDFPFAASGSAADPTSDIADKNESPWPTSALPNDSNRQALDWKPDRQ